MKKIFLKSLRFIWHVFYYVLAPKKAVEYAMRCKDVTEKIDLADQIRTPQEQFRIKLHLSLCQACNNYKESSVILRNAIRIAWTQNFHSETELVNLNQRLLNSFKLKV